MELVTIDALHANKSKTTVGLVNRSRNMTALSILLLVNHPGLTVVVNDVIDVMERRRMARNLRLRVRVHATSGSG